VLALAAVGLVLALAGAGPAQAGQVQVGVVMPVETPASTYPMLAAQGVTVVRTFLTMPDVEPSRGVFNQGWLSDYDRFVTNVRAIGATPVIDVALAPEWASGSADEHALPTDPRAFSDFAKTYAGFMAMLAQRYAGRVGGWEIWNEEDSSAWWTGGGDPARYATLLKAVYPAVKAADPAARVVVGGLTGNDYNFLSGLYAHGAGDSFDAVGVHTDTACDIISPYRFLRDANGKINQYSFLGYRSVHDVMAANGQGSKPIWMTELGWSTFPGVCPSGMWAGQKAGGVSEADQATFLQQALHCLTLDSSMVTVASVYDLADRPIDSGIQRYYGLLHDDGSAKPALATLGAFDHSGDTLSGGCGNFTGPVVSVPAPLNGGSYAKQLPISVSATLPAGAQAAAGDPGLGVARISLLYDGQHHIRNFDDPSHPGTLVGHITWDGAKRLAPGRHTLTVVAYDSEGNSSSTTVTVIHTGTAAGGSAHVTGSGRHAARRPVKKLKRKRTRHRKHGKPKA
jgi:hypothetical protein